MCDLSHLDAVRLVDGEPLPALLGRQAVGGGGGGGGGRELVQDFVILRGEKNLTCALLFFSVFMIHVVGFIVPYLFP